MAKSTKSSKRGSFPCPRCQHAARRVGSLRTRTDDERRQDRARRACTNPLCLYEFWTVMEADREVFESEFKPGRGSKRRGGRPRAQLDGYAANGNVAVSGRPFRMAEHQRLIRVGRFSPLSRWAEEVDPESQLQLLRGPDGSPVVREHGDLREGEIGLVLR